MNKVSCLACFVLKIKSIQKKARKAREVFVAFVQATGPSSRTLVPSEQQRSTSMEREALGEDTGSPGRVLVKRLREQL